MSDPTIPLRDINPPPVHEHAPRLQPYDAPYRLFLATSLVLAIGGGTHEIMNEIIVKQRGIRA